MHIPKYRHSKFPDVLLKETIYWNRNHVTYDDNRGTLDLIKNTKLVLKEIIKIDKNELYVELDEYLTHL